METAIRSSVRRVGPPLTLGEGDGVSVEIIEPIHRPKRGLLLDRSGKLGKGKYHDVKVQFPDQFDFLWIGLLRETRVIDFPGVRDILLIINRRSSFDMCNVLLLDFSDGASFVLYGHLDYGGGFVRVAGEEQTHLTVLICIQERSPRGDTGCQATVIKYIFECTTVSR